MDIWKWVNDTGEALRREGQHRVADLMDLIPSELHENRPERVEALLPEAIAAARAMRNPWLEVFFRHWGLQNRLRNLYEGEKALPEAAALLEFAHRDDTRECPQAVCTTQDIAICYGNVDGRGWVPERLEVCAETLARIEPSRPCYDCISREYALALMDDGRSREAAEYLESQAKNILDDGGEPGEAYREIQAQAHGYAGDLDKALDMLAELDEEGGDEGDRLSRATLRAQLLARAGRLDEAWEALPPFSSQIVPGLYGNWSEAVSLIVHGDPERNDWRLGRLLETMVNHMDRVGSHRKAIEQALLHAHLAVDRGAFWTARRALEVAKRHLPLLRVDGGAAARINAQAAVVAAAGSAARTLPVPAEALCEHIQNDENSSPERDIDLLLIAGQERPDDAQLADLTASAMVACGATTEAINFLQDFVRTHLDDEALPLGRLLDLLLDEDDDSAVERFAVQIESVNPVFAHWSRARLAFARERWADVGTHITALLELAPDAAGARRLWANAAMSAHDFATAVRLRRELVQMSDTATDDDWDLMTAASAGGDWDAVRFSAARIGMQLSSESGPVQEDWGWIRLRYDEDGEVNEYFARRTGPVTAEVTGIAPPGRPQHVHDTVVFDAAALEPMPEDEEERRRFLVPYRVVHTTHSADYRAWFVDGAHPGEEHADAFRAALQADRWAMWVTSGDEYVIDDPAKPNGEGLEGWYFFLASPPGVSAIEVDRRLKELTGHWEHPMCWYRLAEAAGVDTSVHERIAEKYGL